MLPQSAIVGACLCCKAFHSNKFIKNWNKELNKRVTKNEPHLQTQFISRSVTGVKKKFCHLQKAT
jgi:hypothetical protein